ncbi:MAG: hypothetical protein HQK77_14825, partial [Desulfobacterales bacterium]|nr:hypothetical protein [Desulfobacterales bacterium]
STVAGSSVAGSTTATLTSGPAATYTYTSNLGYCPSGTEAYAYGTGIMTALAAIAPIALTGAAVVGVCLLSYAITKAALEP